ncbi:hypothetical protein CDAR_292551 [Caerostris darwini]|uniref:Uncharacterized protein n=1 Tax=Caerostris darwini TaxID=1538125 RepID=A0AAV4MNH6_9ARAC|nr:hypothetical protein CDAR_292551 [Caerostris darwini]
MKMKEQPASRHPRWPVVGGMMQVAPGRIPFAQPTAFRWLAHHFRQLVAGDRVAVDGGLTNNACQNIRFEISRTVAINDAARLLCVTGSLAQSAATRAGHHIVISPECCRARRLSPVSSSSTSSLSSIFTQNCFAPTMCCRSAKQFRRYRLPSSVIICHSCSCTAFSKMTVKFCLVSLGFRKEPNWSGLN